MDAADYGFFDLGGDDAPEDDMDRGAWYQARDRWMRKLLDDPGASPLAKVIGCRLALMCQYKRRWCHPSYDGLAAMTGHSRSKIVRAVRWLERETGYISKPQKGGTDKATGARWPNYYVLNLNIADNFSTQQDGCPEGTGNGCPEGTVISETEGSLTANPFAVASGSPRAPENSANTGFPESEFLNFLALADGYGKLGDAGMGDEGKERIRRRYTLALDNRGVTAERLHERYETHLAGRRGRKYTGDLVIKWLNNPRNYVPSSSNGFEERKPPADPLTSRDRATESHRPKARSGETQDAPAWTESDFRDWLLADVYGWNGDTFRKILDENSVSYGDLDYDDACRFFCAYFEGSDEEDEAATDLARALENGFPQEIRDKRWQDIACEAALNRMAFSEYPAPVRLALQM